MMTDEQIFDVLKKGDKHHKTLHMMLHSLQSKDFDQTLIYINILELFLKILKLKITGDLYDQSEDKLQQQGDTEQVEVVEEVQEDTEQD